MSPSASRATSQQGAKRHLIAWLSAATLGLTFASSSLLTAPAMAEEVSTAPTAIVLGVGANESQRILSWYTSEDTSQLVQLAPSASVINGQFPGNATSFAASGNANTTTESAGTHNRHAVITGLQENVEYTYRVGSDNNWSPAYTFRTQSFEGDYDFLFFGDPQIGSSGDEVADGLGWSETLDYALSVNPDAELLVSGGDQVEKANIETQWDQFLANDNLRQYPWAATIGNHDVGGRAYDQHFYTPNTDRAPKYYKDADKTATTSGGDYWYIYKDVLFIDLNSNSYASSAAGSGGDEAHLGFVTDVINNHGYQAKHTVLVYHHAIYSPADHANDTDNAIRRVDFPTAFSELGVDLVLQGHDHSYSRSYEIKNGEKANPDEQAGDADIFTGVGGVIYVTGNSASGSKYYGLTEPDSSKNGGDFGADPTATPDSNGHTRHWANSVENQENVRTYVKVAVKGDSLTVQNIRASATGDVNPAFDRGNVKWQGTVSQNGQSQTLAKGTIVDEFTVYPNNGEGSQTIQVSVNETPGEFGWTINGTNRLVDLGTAEDHNAEYYLASGQINPITVTDTRRPKSPWSLSSKVGDFTDGDKSFSGKYLGWAPNVQEAGAGATAGNAVASGYDSGSGLSSSRVLGAAAQGHDIGQAVLGADLNLKIPGTVSSGSYRTTLTITSLAQ
ncbi:hypothetical protein brsh051_19000 [Brooklawnia propionicigenes]|uniref:Metallophosphoesterase n=2 Tax=Brooklawnia propionicigenes TaxID=3041175 RepID=A0AAN0MHN6_9ACTN|nr:hypothetical protein brsh051_19000 [Brooklawnia sp. SH051]